MNSSHLAFQSGPSSRLREHRGSLLIGRTGPGTILASAGAPFSIGEHRGVKWYPPRVCGSTHRSPHGSSATKGPSPRLREHLGPTSAWGIPAWTIPASAGAPTVKRAPAIRMTDHPRVCGSTRFSWLALALVIGPSPRLREHLGRGGTQFCPQRTIPASAGAPPGTQYVISHHGRRGSTAPEARGFLRRPAPSGTVESRTADAPGKVLPAA